MNMSSYHIVQVDLSLHTCRLNIPGHVEVSHWTSRVVVVNMTIHDLSGNGFFSCIYAGFGVYR